VSTETFKHADERLHILLDQLDAAWEMLDARLSGRRPWQDDKEVWGDETQPGGKPAARLTDGEYFWEPVPNCWSLRRRGEATSPNPRGKGEWVLDGGYPPPEPVPFTTIAWRMCHICFSPLMRYDYTWGSHSLTTDDIEWPSSAGDAVRFLESVHMQWRTALEGVTSDQLNQVGFSQMPWGLDPKVRFVDLVGWTVVEFAHHAAEIACLRDLYRHSATG
jgi:hypothetical protein